MKTLFLTLLIFVTLGTSALAEVFSGSVIGVMDGDTIRILRRDKTELKVRLSDIDAPEKDQPYGERSKQALSQIIFGKIVEIDASGKDSYGRTLGMVICQGININAKMIETGNAWVYRKYLKDPKLIALEDAARSARKGLWGLQADQIMPPWEWRHRGR